MSKDQIFGFAVIFGSFLYFPITATCSRIYQWWNRDRIELAKYRHPGSQ